MHWVTAVEFARQSNDVTYEEWCDLYYDHSDPTHEQIQKACKMAYTILLRNNFIAEDPMEVVFHGFTRRSRRVAQERRSTTDVVRNLVREKNMYYSERGRIYH